MGLAGATAGCGPRTVWGAEPGFAAQSLSLDILPARQQQQRNPREAHFGTFSPVAPLALPSARGMSQSCPRPWEQPAKGNYSLF